MDKVMVWLDSLRARWRAAEKARDTATVAKRQQEAEAFEQLITWVQKTEQRLDALEAANAADQQEQG